MTVTVIDQAAFGIIGLNRFRVLCRPCAKSIGLRAGLDADNLKDDGKPDKGHHTRQHHGPPGILRSHWDIPRVLTDIGVRRR